jgi:D-alanine-D-alanine ligase
MPEQNGHQSPSAPTSQGTGRSRKGSSKTRRPTLGPVHDLERHLPADWWQSLFNAVYLQTDSDVVENDVNTVSEVDLLIQAAGLEPNDRILDLCCGQGRHSLELARRGFRYVTGVDRSRYLIRLARKRARQSSLDVSFQEGDARKFRARESSMNCVAILGNSFGYFDREEDDMAVLRAALNALCSGGTFALDVVDGSWLREHYEPRTWEWIDQNQLVCRERSLSADGTRLISREVVVHAERGAIVDQFYAERLYSRERLEELLEKVGFEYIRMHGTLHAASDRNVDLGMMAHRIFLTAQTPNKAKPRKTGPLYPEVTVLLGDPLLPDTVKRDGQFNEEDFDTVERMKKALGELPGYEFHFLDRHASLLTELRTNPPQFVLNLCDEGYNNDAFQELHVPAMLEMLGIPCSGAGPTCLGICYNKSLVRSCAEALEVPVPLESFFNPDDQSATLPSVFPALVKPNFGDSSIGITQQAVVRNPVELIAYLEKLQDTLPGIPLLVQEFLSGTEYSVGIIGNPGDFRFLPVLEVDYSGLPKGLVPILGYESKWEPDSPYWNSVQYEEAKIDAETTRQLYDWSSVLFERLGCRDYARFDYRTGSDGTIKLLEVNPNPGWCWDGKLNLMAGFDGLRYADLLQMILEAAQQRVAGKKVAKTNTVVSVTELVGKS